MKKGYKKENLVHNKNYLKVSGAHSLKHNEIRKTNWTFFFENRSLGQMATVFNQFYSTKNYSDYLIQA